MEKQRGDKRHAPNASHSHVRTLRQALVEGGEKQVQQAMSLLYMRNGMITSKCSGVQGDAGTYVTKCVTLIVASRAE